FCQPDCKCAPPECGDGVLTPSNGEQCDPPCSQAQCSGGQICNGLCQCVPDAGACSGTCGLPPPTTFTFTAGVGTGQCGTLTTGTGTTPLACGGLFFGGGNDDVPLPVVIPDKLGNPTKVACCRGTTLNLQKTTLGDTGSLRTCSARGCFFGAPLPVPNPILPAASTCILNIISRDTGGTASCTTGDASILMPLDSDITLAGDIMPKRWNAIVPPPAAHPARPDHRHGDLDRVLDRRGQREVERLLPQLPQVRGRSLRAARRGVPARPRRRVRHALLDDRLPELRAAA